jgi:RHS repeat-associated protein
MPNPRFPQTSAPAVLDAPAARRASAPVPPAPPASTPPFRPAPRVPYELQLTRDATGRIAARTEILDGTPARWDYEYDAHGRIVRVRRNDGGQKPGDVLEEYRYDAQGRRVFEHNRLRDAGGRTYRYARGDELRSCASADFVYDDGGFLTEKRHAGFTTRYAWGPNGALARVDLPDGRVLSYEYQGGRRTAKRVNGEPIELFRWQGPRLAAWQDLRDGTLVRFEYADERDRLPVALHDGTDRFWLAFDQVGSLRAVANDQGKVVKRITYDTFGNVIYESAPQVVIPLGFAGGLRDVDTGLTRFGVRDYDPLFGRFIARDPLGAAAGDPDVYGYCLDDPVNMVDPTGTTGIFSGVMDMFSSLGDGLGSLWDSAQEKLPDTIQTLEQKAPEVLEQTATNTAEKLVDPRMIDAYGKVGMGLAAGEAVPLAIADIATGGNIVARPATSWALTHPDKIYELINIADDLATDLPPKTPVGAGVGIIKNIFLRATR